MSASRARPWRAAIVAALLSAAAFAPPALADDPVVDPVVDRSAFSTTVKTGDEFKTRTYPEQVNFEDANGDWKAIDRALERQADGTVRPAAVDGDAVIPSSLTKPVVLEHDGRSVSFRLQGADAGADRDVTGTKASFEDALSGVDVSYKVRPTGLKELITLAGRSSQRSFNYEVRADSDLSAKIDGGDLVFTDVSGEERFRVAAPLAWDSADPAETANALALSVAKTGDRAWRLTMRADDKWLDDPARVYPVTLDPDYYWIDGVMRFHGANQDCALAGGNQSTLKQCAYQNLQIGYGNSRPYKSVMKFDIASAIPAYATATSSRFLAWQFPSTQKFDVASRLRTVTTDWDNNSTWNNRKDNTPWTTPGGDVSSDPALTGTPITVGPSGYWSYWPAPLAAVNGWIKKTLPNYGFQVSTDLSTPTVKSAYEFTSTDGNQANWPALEVTWVPDTTKPTALASGGQAGIDGAYLGGSYSGAISVSAQDDAAGVASFQLLVDGAATATIQVSCPNDLCPLTASSSFSISTAGVAEGPHELVLRVTDKAGNVSDSAPWTATVDRTVPTFVDAPRASLTPVNSTTDTLAWTAAVDPELGVELDSANPVTYKVRYIRNGSATAFTTVEDNRLEIPHSTSATTVEFQALDEAGNGTALQSVSAPTLSSVFVEGKLYRDSSNARVYLFDEGVKNWISSPAAATQYGFDLPSASNQTNALLATVPSDVNLDYYAEEESQDGENVIAGLEEEVPNGNARAGSNGKTFRCTDPGQVRSAPNKYVTGWCMSGDEPFWTQARFRQSSYGENFFRSGRITGNYDQCGWIYNPDLASGGVDPIKLDGCTASKLRFETSFATYITDDTCVEKRCKKARDPNQDGTKEWTLKISADANAFAATKPDTNGQQCVRYANVGTDGQGKDPVGVLEAGKTARWRYKSRRGDYVMIERENKLPPPGVPTDPKDPNYRIYPEINWTFVKNTCIATPPMTTAYDRIPIIGKVDGVTNAETQAARTQKRYIKGVKLRRKALKSVSRIA